jgi:hypothetical protein
MNKALLHSSEGSDQTTANFMETLSTGKTANQTCDTPNANKGSHYHDYSKP